MRFSSSMLALCAALAIPATYALAQQATPDGPRGQAPSAEMMGRMQDGRLAGAKAMLRLTPEQEKLWGPVESQIRASFEEHAKRRAEFEAKRAERQAKGEQRGERGKIGLPERLDKATERMGQRAERLKAFSAAVKPLYASLSDEQKLVANHVLGQFVGGKGGHHGKHAWGGRGGRHGHHGGGWGGKQADGGEGSWGRHGRGHMRGQMQGMGGMGGEPGGMMGGMGGMGGDKR